MKKLLELPVGSKVREERSGEVFLVADRYHTGYAGVALIADNVVMYSCADAAEPENPDEDIAVGGNNDYELSNIHAWLNSDREDWYAPAHAYDAPPTPENIDYGDQSAYEVPFFSQEAKFLGDYSLLNKPGFLTWFSPAFREALVENDVPCYTPPVPGEIHYGPVPPKYIRARVFLPSTAEMGYEDLRFGNEGYRFTLFNEPRMRFAVPTARALGREKGYVYNDIAFYYFLRSRPAANVRNKLVTFACEHKVGDVNNHALGQSYCRMLSGIRPVLCLRADVPVSGEPDELGVYTLIL